MMKLRIILFIISLVLAQNPLKAQENGEEKFGSWFMYFGTLRISDPFSIHTEVQYRTYDIGSNFNQLLLRAGLNFHFLENAMATIGYGNIPTDGTYADLNGEKNSKEHRIYEQLAFQNNLGKVTFSHRYRLEQRFLESSDGVKDTQHRMRYLLRLTYSLSEAWFLTAYDEIFINLQEPVFGQNRLYGAIGYKVNPNISLQMGYLKNHFSDANYDRFQLGIWWKTDFRSEHLENKNG
jgi:hypothetical protein